MHNLLGFTIDLQTHGGSETKLTETFLKCLQPNLNPISSQQSLIYLATIFNLHVQSAD